MSLNGLLLLNKPRGLSSRKASQLALRAFPRETKFGHVGTLDPEAWGVLPVLIGKATKCMDYLHAQSKVYEFTMQLGRSTTTMDMAGELVDEQPVPNFKASTIEDVRKAFIGKVTQIPPIYSAIKYKGRPLYDYARCGQSGQVNLSDFRREIDIDSLELVEYKGQSLTWRVRCSKGTYVRVLAVDIAKALGTIAFVSDLGRIESSGFKLDDTLSLERAKELNGELSTQLLPIAQLPFVFPGWKSSKSLVKPLSQGQKAVMSVTSFREGLTYDSPLQLGQPQRVLLQKLDDEAFGIGNATLISNDRVEVHMKKGLL